MVLVIFNSTITYIFNELLYTIDNSNPGDAGFFTSDDAQERIAGVADLAPNFHQLVLAGPHHFHMEGDVASLALTLTRFFETGELLTDLLEQAS